MAERYDILCRARKIYKNLSQLDYFEVMEDLALEYYKTGTPDPADLETQTYEVKEDAQWFLCGGNSEEVSAGTGEAHEVCGKFS